ncbi:MAG: ATP-binding protein [Candidatus Omnitrophota bacterium]
MKDDAKKEFQIPSDLSEVQKVSSKVLSILKPLDLSEGVLFDIRLCFEEALINAIKYGNNLKKSLPVRVSVAYNEEELRISIEDQGKGFDPRKLSSCTEGENLMKGGGRGVYLIRQLMDRAEYNTRGNRIVMVKYLKREKLNLK